MRKLAVLGIAVAGALALTGNAQAATPTDITPYGDTEFATTGFRVAFGQVFSAKDSCSANRKVKLVAKKQSGKAQTLDVGVSTAEGAISGGYMSDRVADAQLRFVAAKTKECGSASVRVSDVPVLPKAELKAVGTGVAFLGVGGYKKNGAFAGLILLSQGSGKLRGQGPPPRCFADRKVSLYGDGDLLDHGKTTQNGTWAQHVTGQEFQNLSSFTVKVKKSKAPDGTKCAGGSTKFSGAP